MLGLVFVILTFVVAVQTKPKQETFAPFIATHRKSRTAGEFSSESTSGPGRSSGGGVAGASRWFSRTLETLTGGPRVPQYTITDYYFFHLATLNDGSGQYLGIFQQWWVLTELQEVTGTKTDADGNSLEAQAETLKQEAIQAKIKKDYFKASNSYVEAAKLYERAGSEFNLSEAASAYQDAFKSYKMVQQTALGTQCLEKAAMLFRTSALGASRAANIYNELGDLAKGQDAKRAEQMYREAVELYQSGGDKRALYASIRQVEQLCILHEYAQAFKLYSETIIPEAITETALRFTMWEHMLNATMAHLGATRGDWVMFKKDMETFEEMSADFRGSSALKVLKSLAEAEQEHDADKFRETCRRFDGLRSTGMPDWQVTLLLEESRRLADGELL